MSEESLKINGDLSTWAPPGPRENLLWYAIDFDQTLAYGTWSVDNPTSIPGEPIWENIEKLNAVVAKGFKIAIHTARGWNDYEIIESWLNHFNIHFDKIICGKILAHRYVDDRAIDAANVEW